jgi:choline dehydrogenase-like flavoprotein
MNDKPHTTLQADVVIAGSGPGGATVARELSRKGKKVIVCEAGGYHKWFGYTASTMNILEGKGLTFSSEGNWVISAKTAGGGSVVYGGLAFRPPAWLNERYGIDLREEVAQVYGEVPVQPLPDTHIGPGAQKILQAARDMGLDWRPNDRFIRPEKCKPDCGLCMQGCAEGAKWTAREYLDEAIRDGARLLLRTKVDRVMTESGKAVGVRAKSPQGWIDILAGTVVVSAGGLGTPPILQRSGLYDAGQGFAVDFGRFVCGPCPTQPSRYEIPAATGVNLADDGIILVDATPKPLLYAAMLGLSGPRGWLALPKVLQTKKTIGILMMVKDELEGRVNLDRSFSKPIDPASWSKLNKGTVLAEEILQGAGVRREDIVTTTAFAAHQLSSVRIGDLLDKNCQTPIPGCYCMDASVIPEAWGLPPMVTIVALAKRLARHLAATVEVKTAVQNPA